VKELAGDLITVIGPAAVAWWLFHDPYIAGVWVAVGISVRWAKRKRHESAQDREREMRRPPED
jgi:hypothetical protein